MDEQFKKEIADLASEIQKITSKSSWPYLYLLLDYIRTGHSNLAYLQLFSILNGGKSERVFLNELINGLNEEKERLGRIFIANFEPIKECLELYHSELSFDDGSEDFVYYAPKRLKELFENYPFWSTVEIKFNQMIQRSFKISEGQYVDVSYESLIRELKYKLSHLPKSDEEIAQLIEERTDTTAQERQTIKDKLSWMVELGIIDYLRDTYKPHFDKDNRLAEFVAKIIGEKQRTVQKYLNSHKEWQELDNENFRKVLMKEGINRKQP